MGLIDTARNWVLNWLFLGDPGDEQRKDRLERLDQLKQYRGGYHRQQLKVKANQANDNIAINYVGLVIERSISLLFGRSVEFDLPGETDDEGNVPDEQAYVDAVWEVNKKNILLHKLGENGTVLGTSYLKIMLDEYEHRDFTERLPRLVPVDPMWVEIVTDSEDMERVHQYVIRFWTMGPDGKPRARKEVIERVLGNETDEDGNDVPTIDVVAWTISNYEKSEATSNRWVLMFPPETWEFPFPPLLHWQNLPNPDSVYGRSDIEGIIPLQDRINYVASNLSKIIRYHAHPKTWGRGGSLGEKASWGPDEVVMLSDPNGMLQNLEMESELLPSFQFLMGLRQTLFDISRTVDISSMADKLGALTNFGLRVLYGDALAKLNTKRELYGDALLEINRRLLALANMDTEPGELVWPEALPSDQREESEVLARDLELRLVSKQTVSGKRGYQWETEMERMEGESAGEDNLGSALLRAFNQGA